MGPIGRSDDHGAWIVHRQIALAKHDSGGNACFVSHAWQNGPSGGKNRATQHRHLTHEQFTLAAIGDIIARGERRDWAELRHAALAERLSCSRRCCASAGRTWPIPMLNVTIFLEALCRRYLA